MTARHLVHLLIPLLLPFAYDLLLMPILVEVVGHIEKNFDLLFNIAGFLAIAIFAGIAVIITRWYGMPFLATAICAIMATMSGGLTAAASIILATFPESYLSLIRRPDNYPLLALIFLPGLIQSLLYAYYAYRRNQRDDITGFPTG